MKIVKGNTNVEIPNWIVYAGILTVGEIVSDICKAIKESKNK